MMSTSALAALTVPKLKEKCRELGIPVGGKKADLIARIAGKLPPDKATVTTLPASISQSGDPHVLFIPGTSKATTKRKIPPKNPSYTVDEGAPKIRRTKRSKSTEVPVIIPSSAQQFPSEPGLPSDIHSTTTSNNHKAITSKVQKLTEALSPASRPASTAITTTPHPHLRPVQGLNSITGSSIGPNVISLQSSISLQRPNQATTPTQSATFHTIQKPGKLNIAFQGSSSATIQECGNPLKTHNAGSGLLPINWRKKEIISTLSNLGEYGSKLGKEILPGLGISPPLVKTRNPDMDGCKGVLTPGAMVEGGPDLNLGLWAETYSGGISTAKTRVRPFKRLEPNIKVVDPSPDTTPNYSSTAITVPPPHKQDHEISASIIRNPPRYSLRRQVEKISRILALVAFHSFLPRTKISVPGDFLILFSGLSRNYRYASTLAFTHLVRLEFPGKRTQQWFRNRRIDEMVADVRLWYWHRVFRRAKIIERVQTSWMERVWRFLVWASIPTISTPAADTKPRRFGLWFNGVDQHLLAEPDLEGQFETAIRFWIRRFYVCVTKNGGGYPLLLQDLQDEMVQKTQPLDETLNGDIWRVETKCGSVHFIVGLTGEVIGWVRADETIAYGLNYLRQRRLKTRIGTMIRAKTGARTLNRVFTTAPPENSENQASTNDITWKDLRDDWREHALALISPFPLDKTSVPQRLIESVYRPDPKTLSHGIHESVKLPHHRALAERWVLAQVEAGGISGKSVLETIHGQAPRKKKVALDLQAKFTVESVRCAGEKWISSMKGILAQGVGFVQTPGMGWFVLEETGQNIAQEEYGIQGLWATVLGVDENGVALNADDLERLADMFVWKDILE